MPHSAHSSPTQALRIAVLEDNDTLREEILLPELRDFGFDAIGAASAGALYREMIGITFAIVILDIGLPDEDGISVARHLRATSKDMGLVMLTASREREDHIRALRESVDAFLCKPVDIDVLTATLHSLARRMHGSTHPPATTTAAQWNLEAGGWRLVSPGGKIIALTAPEHDVLTALIDHSGTPVSREHLIETLTGNVYDFDPHRLEMMIHRLRRKVKNRPAKRCRC